jgi:hypothetical protein
MGLTKTDAQLDAVHPVIVILCRNSIKSMSMMAVGRSRDVNLRRTAVIKGADNDVT